MKRIICLLLAMVLLTAAALATTFLLSPRATAVQVADRALAEQRGITAEMQTQKIFISLILITTPSFITTKKPESMSTESTTWIM